MSIAVYAGSFDMPTVGHAWMIARGVELFDRLVVAVGENPDKKPAFDLDSRLLMLRSICNKYDNVEVTHFSNKYLVQYAASVGAGFILRGLRSVGDYEEERGMRHVNQDISMSGNSVANCSGIQTVFLMPPRDLAETSSRLVRGLVGVDGWRQVVSPYVPTRVVMDEIVAWQKRREAGR